MPREGLGELALAALSASVDGFVVFRAERGAHGEVTRFVVELANEVASAWAGKEVGRCRGDDLPELNQDAMEWDMWELMVATLADGEPRRHRIEVLGDVVVECLLTRLVTDGRELVVAVGRNVTELAAGERLLTAAYEMTAEARATLQTALDATSDAFAVYDVESDGEGVISALRLVMINLAGAFPMTGGDPEELVGQDLRDFYPQATETGLWDAVVTAMERQATITFRLIETAPNGSAVRGGPLLVHAWDNTIAPVGEERVVITWRDVTDEVRRERELEQAHDDAHYAATHDPLTGLANRSLLMEELTEALWSSTDDERVGVVYVDLDGFKRVNDRFGHAVGDELLQAVAGRLLRIVRMGDTVARIGGDEFVLVLRRLPRDWDDLGFIERAQTAMEESLMLAAGTIAPSASYGLVVSPPAPRDLDRLMKLADHEMYQRKQLRKERRVPDRGLVGG